MTDKSLLQDLLLLTLLIGILFGTLLGSRPLAVPDEARYSEIPREMLANNDLITPRLNYIKYFEKPAFFYWLQAGVIKTLGINEWALRLTTAFMGLLGCLMTYCTARELYGRTTGWLASLILATSILYFAMARFITLDMTLTVLLAGSLFSFILGTRKPAGTPRNIYMWSMYTFAALATLTKGLIGIVFPGMIIFAWILLMNNWRDLKTYCIPSGIFLWLLITLPWHILVQIHNPEFFHFYVIEQHFARYFTNYADRNQPLWYLPAFLISGFFPWIALLPQALKFNWPSWKLRHQHPEAIFFMLWAAIIYLFFQCSHSQLPPYVLPVFPPLAILVGRYLSQLWQNETATLGFKVGIYLIAAAFLAAAIGIGVVIHWQLIDAITPDVVPYFWIIAFLATVVALIIFISTWRNKVKMTFIALITGMALLLLSANLIHPVFDQKSIKPLAMLLKPILKSNDEVICYHGYYQDLPLYLQRRIIIVGWGTQELEFGMQHQNMTGWYIDDNTLRQEWHGPTRMFMVMSQTDYNSYQQQYPNQLHLLAETQRDVLVDNEK